MPICNAGLLAVPHASLIAGTAIWRRRLAAGSVRSPSNFPGVGVLSNSFRLSDFDYDLPKELIAQAPLPGRSDSRLLVVQGQCDGWPTEGSRPLIAHHQMRELPDLLQAGDHLVFNDTRVVPARLYGRKTSGGRIELMLERVTDRGRILARIRASKSPAAGTLIELHGRTTGLEGPEAVSAAGTVRYLARVTGRLNDLYELESAEGDDTALAGFIAQQGEIPLPPYIERVPDVSDEARYQTVFAARPGAVAAPTAGLHFDTGLVEALAAAGITSSLITLHVGGGTFQPVRHSDLSQHVMHSERVSVGTDTVASIAAARARGGRIIAVGTTCVRALETAAGNPGSRPESGTDAAVDWPDVSVYIGAGHLSPYEGETDLFLRPGSRFRVIDGLITNFHLPQSTLLMLVSSFAGRDTTLEAYRQAVESRYRFFSYGDAMLVWPQSGVRA